MFCLTMHSTHFIYGYMASDESWDSYLKRLEQYFICNDIKDEKQLPALLGSEM